MQYIYSITNLETKITYIGSTTNSNPYTVWKDYVLKSKSTKKNIRLLHEINQYGIDKFKFRILEESKSDTTLHWINKLNAISVNTKVIKEISCFTLDNEWIRDYQSLDDILKDLDLSYGKNKILSCIRGNTFEAFQYRWAWKGKIPEHKGKRVHVRSKIYGYNPSLNIEKVWDSQADATEELVGDRKKNMWTYQSLVSPNNHKKQVKGWYLFRNKPKSWKPASNISSKKHYSRAGKISAEKRRIPIYGVHIDTGKIIKFKSISEASFFLKGKKNYEAAGNIKNNLRKIQNGKFWHQVYGYKWYYL